MNKETIHQEDMWMANKNTKDVQHHYPLEKYKLKAQRYHYTYLSE